MVELNSIAGCGDINTTRTYKVYGGEVRTLKPGEKRFKDIIWEERTKEDFLQNLSDQMTVGAYKEAITGIYAIQLRKSYKEYKEGLRDKTGKWIGEEPI